MTRTDNYHPNAARLALYAGNDCGLLIKAQLWPHVTRCADCQAEIASFQSAKAGLVNVTSELPDTLNWDRLADEITANIHLGLEAGECVAPFRQARPRRSTLPVDWRAATVMAAMLLIMAGAWFLNPPARRSGQGRTDFG